MITLKHGTLSFAFPGFSQRLRLLVERHLQSVFLAEFGVIGAIQEIKGHFKS
jgi:hypothetical protein